MNRIRVVNNEVIPFDDDSVLINDNEITFLANGNYYIEYLDCSNLELCFNIGDKISIMLFELSDKNNLTSPK